MNETNTARRQEIATTILQQLGGRRFSLMTGAKNFIALESGLAFQLGRFSGVKITHCRIILTAADDYTLELLAIRGTSIKTLKTLEGIYAEALCSIFVDETGIELSLGSMHN